jgi:uncharacterized alkaline shock family protein YloU
MEQHEHIPAPAPEPASASGQARPAAPGATAITDAAVAKVAAVAVRSVPGVHSLGVGTGRALGALRGAVGAGPEPAPGITAEVGTSEVAVDVTLTAAYGRPLHAIADDVRAAVFRAVEQLTGLAVIEVNVEIADIHVPGMPERTPRAGAEEEPAAGGPAGTHPNIPGEQS